MHLTLYLLFLFFVGSDFRKERRFGSFTACFTKNGSISLDCSYGNCEKSPIFHCKLKSGPNGTNLVAQASGAMCKSIILDHSQLGANETTNFTCILTRKDNDEYINITIDRNKRIGTKLIKLCTGTTGLLLHRTPVSLWSMVVLCLWRVLVTECLTT